jgi:hypothetical protein
MRPTPYVASLRVYEPLTAFNPNDQARWSQIAVTSPTGWDEQKKALHRTIVSDSPALKPDGAHVLEHEGKRYIAPWSTAARCWAALDDFKSSLPSTLSKYFLSQKIEDAINVNLEVIEDKVSHIITATWSIPPRWFALFEPSDRLRGTNNDGAYTILRTSISNAKQRCLFAHQAVVNAFGNGPIEKEIADLLQWLGIFNDQSVVECDYGGLAVYLEKSLVDNDEPGLNADTSIEDVSRSLAGLAAGDGALAGQGYERLVTRWRRVASFEQAI